MNIMVISPHPDDETLGAGGTLLRLKQEGQQIFWLNITNVTQDSPGDTSFYTVRQRQIRQIRQFYQFNGFHDLSLPPCTLSCMDENELIGKIGTYFSAVQPDWVILPDPEDAHSDHKAVYNACMSCTKVFRYPYIKKVTTMEILSESDFSKNGTAFSPNYFVDISATLDDKLNAMKIYDTELDGVPFPRRLDTLQALATVRGAASGARYAEAFRIIKWIE